MTNLAFVFPGQGSQSVGMMNEWGAHQPLVDSVFEEASSALGYDLQEIIKSGPADTLNQTETTQPAMLASGVAAYRVWQSLDLAKPSVVAGHSLGEYTALVCAGSLDFGDAVKLVAERGKLMQNAVGPGDGAMAAIIGLDDAAVISACESVDQGVVAAVNFNAPGQVVIAGEKASVELAMQNAKDAGAKRALPLPVSVPSHCALMQSAAEQLADTLSKIEIKMPEVTVLHNQNAGSAQTPEEIKTLLKLQLFQPVLWVACVNAMAQSGATQLIEFGPGKVLAGLTRRINKELTAHTVFDADSLDKTQQSLAG